MVARRQSKSLGQDMSLKDSTSVTYFSHPSLQLQKFLIPPQIVSPAGRISLQHMSLEEDISYAKHKAQIFGVWLCLGNAASLELIKLNRVFKMGL